MDGEFKPPPTTEIIILGIVALTALYKYYSNNMYTDLLIDNINANTTNIKTHRRGSANTRTYIYTHTRTRTHTHTHTHIYTRARALARTRRQQWTSK